MARKKRRRSSLQSDVGSFVGSGVTLGVGTAVVAGTGYGGSITPAFSAAGSMMAPVGTTMMAGHALRNLNKISLAGKRRKKRRR